MVLSQGYYMNIIWILYGYGWEGHPIAIGWKGIPFVIWWKGAWHWWKGHPIAIWWAGHPIGILVFRNTIRIA